MTVSGSADFIAGRESGADSLAFPLAAFGVAIAT
jgi:hypothetical protein